MECIPSGLAQVITGAIAIPTIGIGAGVHCDGQVLVTHDLLGMFDKFIPKFVKKFSELSPVIKQSIEDYGAAVKAGSFPAPEHGFADQGDYSQLLVP
jgi:3-methyl-2-oxobutanoate hydroxymethyltransferase